MSRRPAGRRGRSAAKAWAGRFAAPTARIVEDFTTSLAVDRALYPHDIAGSRAHVRALVRAKLLSSAEGRRLDGGLRRVLRELDAGRFAFRPVDEDIHMAIERRLTELIGPLGGKLHTGRSRNDQVALDLRLWLRAECAAIDRDLAGVQGALVAVARRHLGAILPGYTHLQRAQPVLLAHHLLAYHEMLGRDRGRFRDCRERADELPLGAGALAGAGFPLDRPYVARLLGFARVARNSIDAVADRDAAAEFLAAAAIAAVHLSRLAEEVVLWASEEFGFLQLPDAFATGSSMMPQKKNPDVAELVRGRTGRVLGALVALLTTLKGLPLAYNRDLQEDKALVFDAAATVRRSLAVLARDAAGAALRHRAHGSGRRRAPPRHRRGGPAGRARRAVPARARDGRRPRAPLPRDRHRAPRPRRRHPAAPRAAARSNARPPADAGPVGRPAPRRRRHGPG